MHKPELLLPAGDPEKLETAFLFGADAVYIGGKEFNLRAFAGNFTFAEMAAGIDYAHQVGKRVYVTVNILAHNLDIDRLPPYLEQLQQIEADGLIISDPGVLSLARRYAPNVPVTVSTQANITNYESAAIYRELGASRIVLARELSLDEIVKIKERVEVELEIFVHGAMCVSYSGRCLLSHYMTGRSANRGACAHPCRYQYAVVEEKRPGQYFPLQEDERGSYIFNSRDLCLLEYIPQLIEAGIDAFKIEGRMKSPLYVASVARVYRLAVDYYMKNRSAFADRKLAEWMEELRATATRPFTAGFLFGEAPDIQDIEKQVSSTRTEFCGIVKGYDYERGMIEVEQRANFGPGEPLQFLMPGGAILDIQLDLLFDGDGLSLDRARHPRQRVYIPSQPSVPEHSILRRTGKNNE